MFVVRHNLRAQKDLLQAAEWYEQQQQGLGERFLDEYEHIEFYIALNPALFPEKIRGTRQAPLKKFPYVVIFKIVGNHIRIISVFNCHQNPKSLKKLVK